MCVIDFYDAIAFAMEFALLNASSDSACDIYKCLSSSRFIAHPTC